MLLYHLAELAEYVRATLINTHSVVPKRQIDGVSILDVDKTSLYPAVNGDTTLGLGSLTKTAVMRLPNVLIYRFMVSDSALQILVDELLTNSTNK
jgi:hypothetical protein